MEKADQLAGVALHLAENFIAQNNKYFLDYLATFPEDKLGVIKISLLSGEVKPKEVSGFIIKQTINVYKNWFLSEIKKRDIKQEEIEKVIVEVSYKLGNLQRKNYTCHVTIHADGKEFSEKVMATYS